MTSRHQVREDAADGRVTISLRSSALRYLASGLIALLGGAGGGYGAQRLKPAQETHQEATPERANADIQTQLRLQRLEDRTGVLERDRDKHESRLDKLEDRIRPAAYSPRP